MLDEKYLRVLALAFCIAGLAACGADETPVVETDEVSAEAFEQVYHFLDEIQEAHPHFEPKALVGHDLRTILALPAEAQSDSNEPGYSRWNALPEVHRSKRIRIPESTLLEYVFGFPTSKGTPEPVATIVGVEVDDGETVHELFSYTLDPSDEEMLKEWMGDTEDLSTFSGKEVEFIFTTRRAAAESPASSGTTLVWADPVLVRSVAEGAERAPNVVLISLDTLRPDHLGCYGYGPRTSPNIDAFADESMLFENAFASSSWTLPSHASLFTGVPPSTHGGTHWGTRSKTPGPDGKRELESVPTIDSNFELLGEIARENGFRTSAFTEGAFVGPMFGFAQGMERYISPIQEWNPRTSNDLDALRTFRAAAEWLYTVKTQAFFTFLHTYQVHGPYAPPEGYLERLGTPRESSIGDSYNFYPRRDLSTLTDADWKKIVDLYDAEIIYTDEVVGAYFNTLKQMGLWENSLVILISDHGEEFNEHGGFGHNTTLYDEVTRVPLIVKLPGANPPTGRVSDVVALTDVYATICEAMDWTAGESSVAQSFLGLVTGGTDDYDKKQVISEVGFRRDGWALLSENPKSVALRSNTEKYFWYREGESEAFYRIEEDPGEHTDRHEEFPERVGSHREQALDYLRDALKAREEMALIDSGSTAISQEQQEALKALGYLE